MEILLKYESVKKTQVTAFEEFSGPNPWFEKLPRGHKIILRSPPLIDKEIEQDQMHKKVDS